jgi:DUF2911 family protein
MVRFAIVAALLFGAFAANGQILSPRKTTSITIDGKKITVGYGAPSMRGRKIMGRLVPYGEVWCAGANDATSLDTEVDLDIGGLKVPKGSYTLWALPNSDEWRFIVNKETGQWHTEYHADQDLGRVRMSVNKIPDSVEVFRIELTSAGANKGKLALVWENTEASVPITVIR